MNCATRTIKYILFLFNFFCVILGCVLLGFGIWLLNSTENIGIDHGEQLMATLMIVLGSTVLLVGFFGCMGAYMEACCMLISYAVILVILLVVQLVLLSISYTAVSADGVPPGIQNGFDALWDAEQRGEDNSSNNNTLNFYEEWLECCGKKSPEDYFLLDQIPPPSCCKDRDCTNVLNLYMIGCEQKFQQYLDAKTSIFNTISWWLISIEFVGSVFACVLVDSLRNHRDHIRYYS